jgi:hypothetical protein
MLSSSIGILLAFIVIGEAAICSFQRQDDFFSATEDTRPCDLEWGMMMESKMNEWYYQQLEFRNSTRLMVEIMVNGEAPRWTIAMARVLHRETKSRIKDTFTAPECYLLPDPKMGAVNAPIEDDRIERGAVDAYMRAARLGLEHYMNHFGETKEVATLVDGRNGCGVHGVHCRTHGCAREDPAEQAKWPLCPPESSITERHPSNPEIILWPENCRVCWGVTFAPRLVIA